MNLFYFFLFELKNILFFFQVGLRNTQKIHFLPRFLCSKSSSKRASLAGNLEKVSTNIKSLLENNAIVKVYICVYIKNVYLCIFCNDCNWQLIIWELWIVFLDHSSFLSYDVILRIFFIKSININATISLYHIMPY